jgi:MerR family transcriptional regulator, heat shock protein HspR
MTANDGRDRNRVGIHKLQGDVRRATSSVATHPSGANLRLRQDAADDARALYVISVAAELAGVHPQTLRIYERKGLVGPSRTGGGSRRYSPADIERLKRICALTAAGLNLEGVRRVLDLEAQLEALRIELETLRSEAREAAERIHRQYRRELVPFRKAPVVRLIPRPRTEAPGARRGMGDV